MESALPSAEFWSDSVPQGVDVVEGVKYSDMEAQSTPPGKQHIGRPNTVACTEQT
jgi:hypothetical protein